MRITSIIAIYTLFWSLSFFLVLPFRLKRKDGSRDFAVRGEMPGAQGQFSFGRTCFWTTIVAILLFALYYANYVENWVPVETFDLTAGRTIDGR